MIKTKITALILSAVLSCGFLLASPLNTEVVMADDQAFLDDVSSRYGYNDLSRRSNPDARRQLYNKMYEDCVSFYSGTWQDTMIDQYHVIGYYEYRSYGLAYEQMREVYFSFMNDNPAFYFLSTTLLYTDEGFYLYVPDEYVDANLRAKYRTDIQNYVLSYSGCMAADEYTSLLNIHDRLVSNMTYVINNTRQDHNILGAIELGNGVCESYARTLQLVLNYYDFNNVFVGGTLNGGGHAWNEVSVGGIYYFIDSTTDDANDSHICFLAGSSALPGSYAPDTPASSRRFMYDIPAVSGASYQHGVSPNGALNNTSANTSFDRASVTRFVERLYTVALSRGSDPTGQGYWVDKIAGGMSGSSVAHGFFFSSEFLGSNLSNEEYLSRLYHTFFDRDPDPSGFAYWMEKLNNGESRENIFNGFAGSAEWNALCRSYGITV
ncbi:MAG: DUF4214 domain-containing protein [Saccharofermentans sp.]|nr:DUF4214 domain-containing protein [Saccharofermentans sp.]